jgi:hypothetical protein
MLVYRVLVSIAILGAIIIAPWWVFAIMALVSVFLFKKYYEIIVLGFIFDLIYGLPINTLEGNFIDIIRFSLIFTISSVVVFFVVERLKKNLKFYS